VFAEICVEPVDDDGVVFDPASIEAEPIRAEEEYVGVRVTFQGLLGKRGSTSRWTWALENGFAVEPVMLQIPSLVGMPGTGSAGIPDGNLDLGEV